jgi:membrane-associated protease RseP (regulator of RpoE activity)
VSFPTGREQPPLLPFEPPPVFVTLAPPRPPEPTLRQVILLLLTIVSTTFMGALQYVSFERGFDAPDLTADEARALFSSAGFYIHGLWYSLSALAILGCHEMGHYVACLRYRVDASRPYFIPAPPIVLSGTLGAFIRIRSRIPGRVALFDIGIAGPIAGFVVAVPVLIAGLWMSAVVPLPADQSRLVELGEPILFRLASSALFADVPAGHTVMMHPMAFAAWFGLMATSLNLFPFGQLDGGHIVYAVLGQRSRYVTLALVPIALALVAYSWSWLLWTALLLVMLVMMGPQHPPTLDDDEPLGSGRLWLAVFALLMLVLCFTPAPIEPFVAGGSP